MSLLTLVNAVTLGITVNFNFSTVNAPNTQSVRPWGDVTFRNDFTEIFVHSWEFEVSQ